MTSYSKLFISTLTVVFPLTLQCQTATNSWLLVRHLPEHATFTFIEQHQTCHSGQIVTVTDTELRILPEKQQTPIAIPRSTLIRIRRGGSQWPSNNPNLPLLIVYSGRSSWTDVLAFAPFALQPWAHVRMQVVTTGGRRRKGDLSGVTSNEVSLRDAAGRDTTFPRADVSLVDYLQLRPLSDSQEFDWEELAPFRIFDPALYFRMFHIDDTVPVRLFDRALPEDDAPVRCNGAN
jgi:hypothetical protein